MMSPSSASWLMELPPRARRILNIFLNICTELGTTSACAENTASSYLLILIVWNYLRVRGEYHSGTPASESGTELPPRARRIHPPKQSRRFSPGTTSACAENTGRHGVHYRQIRNYLRVRGEYTNRRGLHLPRRELPPRARRIRGTVHLMVLLMGTTSACAENTGGGAFGVDGDGNYLRVRGEYGSLAIWLRVRVELPPRARRIRWSHRCRQSRTGTTSACAENTWAVYQQRAPGWNYLRVRGEYPK